MERPNQKPLDRSAATAGPRGEPPLFVSRPGGSTRDGLVGGRCYGCHTQCAMRVHLEKGKVVRVEGEPRSRNAGALCAKAHASVRKLYAPDRLNYPMKRTKPKGAADPGWVRISWDEALDTIAGKVKEITTRYGAHAVAVGQGTGRGTTELNFRLAASIGTPNVVHPGTSCRGPNAATTCLTVGHHLRADSDASACLVFWGHNESWGHPAFAGPHLMSAIFDRGAKLIVVDPRFEHPLAHKADVFLPVRPGSDGALMLSWIQVILSEELYDVDFVTRYTNAPFLVRTDTGALLREGDVVPDGDRRDFLPSPMFLESRASRPTCLVWDRGRGAARPADDPDVQPALFGTFTVAGIECRTVLELLRERADEWTPERAAAVCWTGSAEKIREAARLFATSPSACTDAGSFGIQGLEGGHTNTFQTLRAQLCLDALTGNINRPGGDCGRPHWHWLTGQWRREGGFRSMTPWGAPDDHEALMIEGPHPEEPALAEYPLQPGMPSMSGAFRAMATGEPYPIKAYLVIQGNPLGGWCEDQAAVYEGLKSLEFLVHMDLHLTPTGHLADIVLPAGLGPYERGRHKIVEQLYERRSDEWFYLQLGQRLAPEWWPWGDEAAYWDWLEKIENANRDAAGAAGFPLVRGIPAPPLDYFKQIDPETGKPVGFPTPTGRIELYSVIARQHGIDPLPRYEEPVQSPIASPELAKQFPLVLSTGARLPVYYHSEHRSDPLQRELYPHPEVEIHPETAAAYGVRHEEWVWIETRTGKIRMKAKITAGIMPGVVSMQHGWWQGNPALKLPGYGWNGANANFLIPSDEHDAVLGVPAFRSQLCRVSPAPEPPFVWESPYYSNGVPEAIGGEGAGPKPERKEDKP